MSRLTTEWYKGAKTETERAARAAEILSSRETLNILKKLLEDRLAALETGHTQKDKYESPSWPYLQADYVGAKRTLMEIIELVTTED